MAARTSNACSRACGGCSRGLPGARSTATETDSEGAQLAFAHLSRKIHRGFRFDRMFKAEDGSLSPESVLKLDQLAMTSMKTQDVPRTLMDRIVRLLRDFGQKKDVERFGRYLLRKTRARTSSEVPRVLPSVFLTDAAEDDVGDGEEVELGIMARLKKNPAFKDLFAHAGVAQLDDAAIGRLSIANREERRQKLYQMFWSPEAALAYVAHRYPAVWGSTFRVLHELSRRAPDFRPRRLLDFAAGPAPGVAASREVWPGQLELAVAVEPSEHMSQVGRFLTADLEPEVIWQRCLYDSKDRFDLIVASYVQMEIRGQSSRDMMVKQLWNRLEPGGVLLLMEPGTPAGFRFMHHTRELFISRLGTEDFHIVGPCMHEGLCPLALTGKEWCHFAQRVRRTPHRVYNKGSKRRFLEEDKFSYLCLRKGLGPRQRYHSAEHAPTEHERSYFWPRVLFPPIKAGRHTLIDVCSAPHNFERISTSKGKAHNFGYRWSRKTMWGDLWRFPKRVTRPEARQYIPEESRKHLDRLAKRAWKAAKWEEDEPGFEKEKEKEIQNYGR